MATKDQRAPVIIRRVKKGGHGGHHGGAWKIAYADFVTAMMAFFLLMWLLGSTTKGDLLGIAEYFRTPLRVAFTGGSGAGETSNVIRGGSKGFLKEDTEAPVKQTRNARLRKDSAARESRIMAELKQRVDKQLDNSVKIRPVRSQIRTDLTGEGLRIQIIDDKNRPMFDSGSAIVKDYMRDILREMGPVLNAVDYRLTLSGHTDAVRYSGGERGYSNWELSADRANASRRELVAGGMAEAKVLRVVGASSSINYERDHPEAPVNRRISIIVMNHEAEERVLREMGAVIASDAEELSARMPAPETLRRPRGAGALGLSPGSTPGAATVQ